jgi:hypothetical protein
VGLQLLELIVVAWLPGAVVFRLPFVERERRAALDAEERLFWAIVISLGISLAAVLALAASSRYSFKNLIIADLIVTLAGCLVARFDLRLGSSARKPGLTILIPIGLAALGLWRFFPPSEYIIGGKDPGVYLNEGIQIAQRGAIVATDPVIASVPNFARDLFFPSHQQREYYGLRFMGFFIRDPDAGTVVGQFPHLFPASIAIGYGIDGLTGARRTIGVWAILGLLAVYFTGVRAFGRTVAGAACGLLALNVIEVWFGRYPNAELVMQTLLFAALLADARAHVDDDRFFAPVAGFLLGLLLFLRYDSLLGIAGVLGGLALSSLIGRRVRWSFLATLAVCAALAAIYMLGPMRAYVALPILFLGKLDTWQYAALTLAAGTGVLALTIGARIPGLAVRVQRATPILLSLIVVAAALYALYFRQPGGKLTDYDAYALRTFANFYFTVPALLAAIVGYALAARSSFWRAPSLFITIAIFALTIFYKIRIVPDHFWMARRFLAVILPGAMLFTCYAALAGTLTGTIRNRVLRGALGSVFLILVAVAYARASRPILQHVEYAGIIPRLEQLSKTIGDRDLVIVESRDASDTHTLALPLADIYARNVLVLASRRPDKSSFGAFLDWARQRYRRVLFIGGGGTDLLSHKWDVTPISSERFQVPEYEAPQNIYPRLPRAKEFDYSIYAFTDAVPEGARAPFDLDVGVRDDLHVLRFHAKEITEGHTFRWSRDVSYVSITDVTPASREVVLWMSDGGRPPAAPPADVTIELDNVPLGTVRVTTGFKPYSLEIPPSLAARLGTAAEPVPLKLTTKVWVPEKLLGTPDDRDLGVMLDRVAVR